MISKTLRTLCSPALSINVQLGSPIAGRMSPHFKFFPFPCFSRWAYARISVVRKQPKSRWARYQTAGRPGTFARGHVPSSCPALWNRLESPHSGLSRDRPHQQTDASYGKSQAGTVGIWPALSFFRNKLTRELREWETLSERFRLDEPRGRGAVLASVAFLVGRGIPSPKQMADISPSGLEALCGAADFSAIIRSLWGVGRATFAPSSSSSSFCLVAPDQQVDGLTLTRAVEKHAAKFARPGRLRIHLSKKLKQKSSFDKLGPMQKIDQLEKAHPLPATLERFRGDAARTNMMKQVR